MNLLFYGHTVDALLLNMLRAIIGPFLLSILVYADKKKYTWMLGIIGYIFLLCMPNTTYLFMEGKHLLWINDGIADRLEIPAILVFGTMSILGYLLSIGQIYFAVIKISFLQRSKIPWIIILSVLSAWGTTLGMQNLYSWQGILFPNVIIEKTMPIIYMFYWQALIIMVSLLLTIGSLLLLKIFKKGP